MSDPLRDQLPDQLPARNQDELEALLNQAIEAQQATGVPLIDDLADARPAPTPDFTRELEAYLVQHWYEHYDDAVKERPMTYEEKSKRKNDLPRKNDAPIQLDRRPTRQRSLVGTVLLMLILFGTSVAGVSMLSLRTWSTAVSFSSGPFTMEPRNIQPESTADLFNPERTAEATPIVYIDSSWGVTAPTAVAQSGQVLTSTPLPTDPDSFIQAATDIINTVTHEAINLTAAVQPVQVLIQPTPTPLHTLVPTVPDPLIQSATDIIASATQQVLNLTATPIPASGVLIGSITPTFTPLPTDPDYFIQAATDIVGTVTQESIDETAMANGMQSSFPVPTATPVPTNPGGTSAVQIEIPENWLTIGVPMPLIESTDGRVVQGGVVRLINAATGETIWNLALVVDQKEDNSGEFSNLIFALPSQGHTQLTQAISTSTLFHIKVVSENNLVPVIATTRDIAAGTTITTDMVVQSYYPLEFVPPSFGTLDEVIGRTARSDISYAAPIIQGVLSSPPTPVPTVTPYVDVSISESRLSCIVFAAHANGVTIHEEPSIDSSVLSQVVDFETLMTLTDRAIASTPGEIWYNVTVSINQETFTGWVQADQTIVPVESSCPILRLNQTAMIRHVMTNDQTIKNIAIAYGVPVEVIRHTNGLHAETNTLEAGAVLLVPLPQSAMIVESQATDSDPLIQAASDFVATVTQESLNLTTTTVSTNESLSPNLTSTPLGNESTVVRHTLLTGETLADIAHRYGSTVEAILGANNFTDDDMIGVEVGTELIIPLIAETTVPTAPPTDSDPLIQAATDIMATVTQENIDATATQSLLAGTPTETATPYVPTEPPVTPTAIPTLTATSMLTITPEVLCRLIAVNEAGLFIRARPTANSPQVGIVPSNLAMEVMEQAQGSDDGRLWYRIRVTVDQSEIFGWVRSDGVTPQTGERCPELPSTVITTATPLDLDAMATLVVATITQQALVTPTATPVPEALCQVAVVNAQGAFLRERPTMYAPQIDILLADTAVDVIAQALSADDGSLWYRVYTPLSASVVSGWIEASTIAQQPEGSCPTTMPQVTVTPEVLCRAAAIDPEGEAISILAEPTTNSSQIVVIPSDTSMDVTGQIQNFEPEKRSVWYRIRVVVDGSTIMGWVHSDTVAPNDPFCSIRLPSSGEYSFFPTLIPTLSSLSTLTPTSTALPLDVTLPPMLLATVTPVEEWHSTATPPNTALCTVTVNQDAEIVMYAGPSLDAEAERTLQHNSVLAVLRQMISDDDRSWYFVRVNIDSSDLTGWVLAADTVAAPESGICPSLPEDADILPTPTPIADEGSHPLTLTPTPTPR
jgi:LysM repeat protein